MTATEISVMVVGVSLVLGVISYVSWLVRKKLQDETRI